MGCRVQGGVGPAQGREGIDNVGEVAGAEAGRVGATGGNERLGSDAACPEGLPQPLEVGTGGDRPVFEHLAQPGRLDGPEVDHPLRGRPAARSVGLKVEQPNLPQVARAGVGTGVLGPGTFDVAPEVAKQTPDRAVVLHTPARAHCLEVDDPNGGGFPKAWDQDPKTCRGASGGGASSRRWSPYSSSKRTSSASPARENWWGPRRGPWAATQASISSFESDATSWLRRRRLS